MATSSVSHTDTELVLTAGTLSLPTKKHNLLQINRIGQRLARQVASWMSSEPPPHLHTKQPLRNDYYVKCFIKCRDTVIKTDDQQRRTKAHRSSFKSTSDVSVTKYNMYEQWCKTLSVKTAETHWHDGLGDDTATVRYMRPLYSEMTCTPDKHDGEECLCAVLPLLRSSQTCYAS